MTRRVPWALAALVGLWLAGCATVAQRATSAHQALMAKAVFDLACSKNEIRLARLLEDRVLVDVSTGRPVTRAAYAASGCGERIDYVVDCQEDEQGQSCTAQLTRDVAAAFPPGAR
ncbi:MAG: hypothetical protein IT382_05535 [Deltaproteobacteria bacterium]|nr:hypothetical protein [Deltaproteobacteria bacterium]